MVRMVEGKRSGVIHWRCGQRGRRSHSRWSASELGDETEGLNLEEKRERGRSAARLPASMAGVAWGIPGNARWSWGLGTSAWIYENGNIRK